MNNKMRISGFASGLDSDKMVQDMMRVHKLRPNRMKAQVEKKEWRQEAMRSFIGRVQTFNKKYFDVLNSSLNFRSSTAFSEFTYSVTDSAGEFTNAIEMSMRADATKHTRKIDYVKQLASKEKISGKELDFRGIHSEKIDIEAFKKAHSEGKSSTDDVATMVIKIGSNTREIGFSKYEIDDIKTTEELANRIKSKVTREFGADYANVVSHKDGRISFDMKGNEIRIYNKGGDKKTLQAMGISSGATSYAYKNKTMGDLIGDSYVSNVTINGEKFEIDRDMKVSEFTKMVSNSSANVDMYYDPLDDKMHLNAKLEGTANSLNNSNNITNSQALGRLLGVDMLFDMYGKMSADVTHTAATNAVVSIDGHEIIKDTNNFNHEGMNITLKAVTTEPITLSAKLDKDKVIDKITDFVEGYNAILEEIHLSYEQKEQKGFGPLTDEQKENMTEKQIEQWEKKAKQGIMRGDRQLLHMAERLRRAITDPIPGTSVSMLGIGISSKKWQDRGKLTIDRDKLENALERNYNDVVQLFTKKSELPYVDRRVVDGERVPADVLSARKAQRYKENGISSRIDDILKDFTRTTRGTNGKKGSLVTEYGVAKDTSDKDNKVSNELRKQNKRLDKMLRDLAKREEALYRMFSRMETAMAKMQSQSNSLFGMLGGGQN